MMRSKKRIICFFMAVVMTVLLCSCAGEKSDEKVKAPDGFLLAENEKTDYYFFYPSTWLLDRNDAGLTCAYVSENDFSNVSVAAFTASNEYPDLLSYAKDYYFAHLSGDLKNLKIDMEQDGKSIKRTDLVIDRCPALAVNYSASFYNDESYNFRAWFISRNGYIYTVLYTAKADLFEAHLDEATAIAEGLKFR